MAIQSVGGQEPTVLEGTAIATPGGATVPPSGSATASVDTSGEGAPFAVVDGQEFKTQEELSAWWDKRQAGGDASTTAPGGNDTITGGNAADSLTGGQADDALKARLKEAGGIYADERYEPFAVEFEKTGDLSAEALKKAAETFGIPEAFVKSFVDSQKAARSVQPGQPTANDVKLATAIIEVVPNETDYRALLAWGKEGLSAQEQAAYNQALDRADEVTAKALLRDFNTRFLASGNAPGPRDVTREGTGAAPTGGTTGFASSAEMQTAINDPRYAQDPAYRRSVEQRIHASTF